MAQDHLQKKIYTVLTTDATLDGLLGGHAVERVKWRHVRPQRGDDAPFVVFWRSGWQEDPKWKDKRVQKIGFKFQVCSRKNKSQVLRDIMERIHYLLDGSQRALTCSHVSVAAAYFTGGGPDLYDEGGQVWLVEGDLELTVEFMEA